MIPHPDPGMVVTTSGDWDYREIVLNWVAARAHPNPDPNPRPNPDHNPDPNPSPNPDPSSTLTCNPSPTPSPNPNLHPDQVLHAHTLQYSHALVIAMDVELYDDLKRRRVPTTDNPNPSP